jgi:hypothetical protein
VDSVGVVIVDAFAEEVSEVVLVQNDHVIQQLPASATDPSQGNPILPWTSKGCPLRLDSEMADHLSHPV